MIQTVTERSDCLVIDGINANYIFMLQGIGSRKTAYCNIFHTGVTGR